MKPLYKIGVTGGIASGKTTLINYLAKINGIKTLKLDLLAHDLYKQSASLRHQIRDEFGHTTLTPNGLDVNRTALGAIVFGNTERLNRLNQIVWPELEFYTDFLIRELEANNTSNSGSM